MSNIGSLVCVGTGITLGAHITPRALNCIKEADVVFLAVSDGIVEKWIEEMNDDVRSLQVYYASGKSRNETYREMVEAIMEQVRLGKKVCGAFYGHPGVFALAPHKSIKQAKLEGFSAYMEPGISAEDCLIADLGIDPGRFGCQQYEASQFIFYKRIIDSSAYLILWQIGIVGDTTLAKLGTSSKHRRVLLKELYKNYQKKHRVILYEAPTLPIKEPRIEYINLEELEFAVLNPETTLVIPPAIELIENVEIKKQLAEFK